MLRAALAEPLDADGRALEFQRVLDEVRQRKKKPAT